MLFVALLVLYLTLKLTLACVIGLVLLWGRVFHGAQPGTPIRGTRKAVGPAAFGFLWTAQLPLPALIAIGLMIVFGPQQNHTMHSLDLAPTQAGQLTRVGVSPIGHGLLWDVDPNQISIYAATNSNSGGFTHAEIDLTTFTYTNVDGGNWNTAPPAAGTPVTDSSLLALLGRTGLDTADPTVQAQAADLLTVLQALRTQNLGLQPSAPPPTPSFTVQNNSWQGGQPVAWWVVSVLAFWLLVWIAGFALFTLVRRRQRRAWEREVAARSSPLNAASPH